MHRPCLNKLNFARRAILQIEALDVLIPDHNDVAKFLKRRVRFGQRHAFAQKTVIGIQHASGDNPELSLVVTHYHDGPDTNLTLLFRPRKNAPRIRFVDVMALMAGMNDFVIITTDSKPKMCTKKATQTCQTRPQNEN